MPLDNEIIDSVMGHCKGHLPAMAWYQETFDFIDDANLQNRLAHEFYAARYIYKLMEGLNVSGDELYAHIKFQIIQYASIYEAVICYLLWAQFSDHARFKVMEKHKVYKPISALSHLTKITYEDKEAFVCLYKDERTPFSSIKFADKVDAAVDIGFLEECYADEIKEIYSLRNLIHIETASKKGIEFDEIEKSKLAYRRMDPFIKGIKEFLTEEKREKFTGINRNVCMTASTPHRTTANPKSERI